MAIWRQIYETRTTSIIRSSLAPPLLLVNEGEAPLLAGKDAQHLFRDSHVVHIHGVLDHVSICRSCLISCKKGDCSCSFPRTAPVKGRMQRCRLPSGKTHLLQVLQWMIQECLEKLLSPGPSFRHLPSFLYPLTKLVQFLSPPNRWAGAQGTATTKDSPRLTYR